MMNLKLEISKLIKGDVVDDEETKSLYSHDASLFELEPRVVVFPKDSEDVCKLIEYVNSKKKNNPDLSITGRGAGTDMSGGAINNSIILDFCIRYDRVDNVVEGI